MNLKILIYVNLTSNFKFNHTVTKFKIEDDLIILLVNQFQEIVLLYSKSLQNLIHSTLSIDYVADLILDLFNTSL
jgi:hypothetical protein